MNSDIKPQLEYEVVTVTFVQLTVTFVRHEVTFVKNIVKM